MSCFDPLSEPWLGPCPESELLAASGAPERDGDTVPLVWHGAMPGGDLAQLVESFEREGLEDLEDYDLVELAAAAGRLAAWAHHVAASAASELADRPAMEVATPAEFSASLTPSRLAGEEIAMRLGWSPRAGQKLVREGTLFGGHLHATGEALRTGEIDAAKARAIADGLEDVPVEIALGVQDAVLPRAPRRTARQLAADVRAAIVEIDPPEAVARREAAMRRRHVSRPVPLGDGMVGLWLRTGAIEATALYESIDRAARHARIRGDGRSLDQLRADLLVERGLHGGTCTTPTTPGYAPGSSLGLDTGAVTPTSVGTPRGTASGTTRASAGASAEAAPRGSRCPDAVRVDIRVLVPLSTLLGTRDEAALLVGHGPIDPELARSLARGGTWRRLVTDPQSGTVLDVGRTRYAPPADLAELVRFRDLECVRPGCSTSAWHSELDHVKPFDQEPARRAPARGGQLRDGPLRDGPTRDEPTRGGTTRDGTTSAANLAPLSKGCHQIKTHGGFNLERTSSTTYRWSTPTGHVYDVETSPSLRALAPNDPIHRAREDLGHLARRDAPPPSEQGRPSPPYGDTTRIEGAPDPGPPPY